MPVRGPAGCDRLARRLGAVVLTTAVLVAQGCAASTSAGGPGKSASGEGAVDAPRLDVRSLRDRPVFAVIARDGDPKAGIALVALVGGGPVATASVAALLDARLAAAGVPLADATADRHAVRARVLVGDPDGAERAVRAVHAALSQPLGDEPAVLKLAAARVAALKRGALDDVALLPLAECSGEPGLSAADQPSAPTRQQLEAWRASAYATSSAAFAVTGPVAIAERAVGTLSALAPWPDAPRESDAWGVATPPGTYIEATRRRGSARVSVAVRTRDRAAALSFAERALDTEAPLRARLLALATPFRVRRVVATTRRRGACVLVEVEGESATSLEAAAARAVAVVRDEIAAGTTGRGDPFAPERRIRAVADPRDAAAAAAAWSLGADAAEEPVAHVAVGIAAPSGSPRPGAPDANAPAVAAFQKRLVEALERESTKPSVDLKAKVERGQGELWALVASACPVLEPEGDAGLTALALTMSSIGARGGDGSIEPWVAPDGAGLIVHGSASARGDLVQRLADAVARAFAADAPREGTLVDARAILLARSTDTGDRAREPLALGLAPGQPTRLAPWGLFDGVARGGGEAARLRWASLARGPVRIAVLATESAEQGATIARAVERYLPRESREAARQCPTAAPWVPPVGAQRAAPLPAGHAPRAFVTVPVDASGGGQAAATLTAHALGGDGGLLERALESTGARASAYLLGAPASSVLVVEIAGPDPALDPAIAQVRALLSRVGRGALSAPELERATARFAQSTMEAQLSPRKRLVDLWRGLPSPDAPTAPALAAWLAAHLRDDRVSVTTARVTPP